MNTNQITTSLEVTTEVHKLNGLELLLSILRSNGDHSLIKTQLSNFLQSTAGCNLLLNIFKIVTFIPRTILKIVFLIPRIVVYTILTMSGIIGTILKAGFDIALAILSYPKAVFVMIWRVVF